MRQYFLFDVMKIAGVCRRSKSCVKLINHFSSRLFCLSKFVYVFFSRGLRLSDNGLWCRLSEHTNSDSYQARVGDRTRSVVVPFPAALLVSCHWSARRTDHILQLSMSWKTMQKTLTWVFFHSQEFIPLALSCLIIGCLFKMANKQARNLPVPVKGWDLTRHQ